MATLEGRKLVKRYTSIPAVDHVDFTIRAGEVLGYVGPNGSGKSTTVKMLVGLLDPSDGQVLCDGEDIRRNLTGYKQRLGYVPEVSELYPFLSGWEYLEMVAILRHIPPAVFEAKAAAMLESLLLFPHRHALIGSYSKGMRQRIVIIAALLHNPDVLVLDEPFSGLDTTSTLVIRRVIGSLARSGKTIFFSSPVLEEMERICSHVVLLKKGRIAASGSTGEIRDGAGGRSLEQAFLQVSESVDADRIAQNFVATVLG
jgi:ABC-2 type transport system ATP-binding protein